MEAQWGASSKVNDVNRDWRDGMNIQIDGVQATGRMRNNNNNKCGHTGTCNVGTRYTDVGWVYNVTL